MELIEDNPHHEAVIIGAVKEKVRLAQEAAAIDGDGAKLRQRLSEAAAILEESGRHNPKTRRKP
jgi:hypothetical protein